VIEEKRSAGWRVGGIATIALTTSGLDVNLYEHVKDLNQVKMFDLAKVMARLCQKGLMVLQTDYMSTA
jgi:hypothetical protein